MPLDINLSKEKNKAKKIDLERRKTTFCEVIQGFDKETAMSEARRCLNCKNMPCTLGCPINNYIPEFIKCVANGEFEEAFEIISKKSNFPAICSRVCAQESQCESKCTRGINGEPVAIGMLERFVTDLHYHNYSGFSNSIIKNNESFKFEKKVQNITNLDDILLKNNINLENNVRGNAKNIAIIGSGPSGLACGEDLCKMGYDVIIFEHFNFFGGVMHYGIPDFRLPREIVLSEIQRLKNLGVKFIKNATIGKDFVIEDLLKKGFDAVYIATGADSPKSMGIPGENLNGVLLAQDFLLNCKINNNHIDNFLIKNKIVTVVGGGNVAIDSARTAVRLGAKKVQIVYRRSFDEMPARKDEVHDAIEEGVEFNYLTNPIKILAKSDSVSDVGSIECVKMQLGEPDEKGRRRSIPINGSEFLLETDCVIYAIGSTTNEFTSNLKNEISFDRGLIVADNETGETSKKYIFAGGDVVSGPKTVVHAVKFGKNVAKSIDKLFK